MKLFVHRWLALDHSAVSALLFLVPALVLSPSYASAQGEGTPGTKGQVLALDPVDVSSLLDVSLAPPIAATRSGRPKPHGRIPAFKPTLPPNAHRSQARLRNPLLSSPATLLTDSSPQEFQATTRVDVGGSSSTPSPPPSASFEALADNLTKFNPDTQGAVGPEHLMVTLASEIRIQSRSGQVLNTFTLDSFWSMQGNPTVYDPRVIYDTLAQRWIHVASANFTSNPGLLVAVSQTSYPTGSWNRYFIDVDTLRPIYADSPNLGFNNKWIVVQANMFTNSFPYDFAGSDIFVFNKANLLAGLTANFTRFSFPATNTCDSSGSNCVNVTIFGDAINAQVPAVTQDPFIDTLYLVGQYNNNFEGYGFLRVYAISGAVDSPVFNPGVYGDPGLYPSVPAPWEQYVPFDRDFLPQSGTTNKIAAGDCRIQNVVYRNGRLWTTQTIFLPETLPKRTAVQWWEILPNTGSDNQVGRVDDSTGQKFYAYPSIAVNAQDDVLIGYSSFASNQFPSASYSFRAGSFLIDPPDLLRASSILKTGEFRYYVPDPSNGKNRWGDWSAAVVDPVNNIDLWTLQEYAKSSLGTTNRWGTWWGRISPPVDLIVSLANSPNTLFAGQNITYTISVTNNQADRVATGVKLVDTLSPKTAFLSANSDYGGCGHTNGIVTCDIGDLLPGFAANISVLVRTLDGGQLTNRATASAFGPDVNTTNNTAVTINTVNAAADIALAVVASQNPVHVSSNLTYSATITNLGPSAAPVVKLTNSLPASLTYVLATPSQGNCSPVGSLVTCNFGTVASGAVVTARIVVKPNTYGLITNNLTAGSSITDLFPSNNGAGATIRANALPTIQSIGSQTINEDTVIGPLNFTVSDVETAASNLDVIAFSSNQNLVPNDHISLGGTGPNRTITVTPRLNQNGVVTITRVVTDNDGAMVSSAFTLTYTAINDPPSVSEIPDQVTDEDTRTVDIPFIIGDPETAVSGLGVVRGSSNVNLVPTARIFLGGSGSNRTVYVLPATNASGTVTITITVGDGILVTRESFQLTINPINDLPVISDILDRTVKEDTSTGIIGFTISDVESAATNLTLRATSSNPVLVPTNNISFTGTGSSRSVSVLPATNQFGLVSVGVIVTDQDGATRQDAFALTVTAANDPPTLNAIPDQTISEDSGPVSIPLSGITGGPTNEIQTVTITATSSNTTLLPHPQVLYTSPDTTGTVILNPATNAFGTLNVGVRLVDTQGANGTNIVAFRLTIDPVNDAPTLSVIPDQTTNEDVPTQPIPFQVTDVESRATNLTVTAMSSDSSLIPTNRITFAGNSTNRTIALNPVTNAFGSATITLTATDGTNAFIQSFLFVVNAINDPPTLTHAGNLTTLEDIPTGTFPITLYDVESTGASLTLTTSNSNPVLLPPGSIALGGQDTNRTLAITPARDQNGSATITLILSDPQNATNTFPFTLTVNAVNDPPLLTQPEDAIALEDIGLLTVAIQGIAAGPGNESQSVTISATSNNPNLIPTPTSSYTNGASTAELSLRPVTNGFGIATITVTVDDNAPSNNLATTNFKVSISPVNDPPTIQPIANQSTPEDTPTPPIQIRIGDVDGSEETLSLTAMSGNEEIIANDGLLPGGSGTNRTLVITPLQDQSGSTFILVHVSDTNGVSASTQFQISVTPVNDAPSVQTLSELIINEDQIPAPIPVTISDPESAPQDLSLSATCPNSELLPSMTLSGTGSLRSLAITPATNASGTATITLTCHDGNKTNQTALTLTVHSVNDAPTLNPMTDLTLYENAQAYSLNVGGIAPGPTNEMQNLVLTATSSDPATIPHPSVTYTSPQPSGSLSLSRAAIGSARITVQVQDDGSILNGGVNTTSRSFQLSVRPLPTLHIRRQSGQLRLSWPAADAEFVLHSRQQADAGEWIRVTTTPILDGQELTVTLPISATQQFYQLRHP